jgi:carbonic anhydrase
MYHKPSQTSWLIYLKVILNDFNSFLFFYSHKAMNLLHSLQDEQFSSQENRRKSPLRAWLCRHADTSLEKFQQLKDSNFLEPLMFQAETPMRKFVAYIDPENKFAVEDKLSQVK